MSLKTPSSVTPERLLHQSAEQTKTTLTIAEPGGYVTWTEVDAKELRIVGSDRQGDRSELERVTDELHADGEAYVDLEHLEDLQAHLYPGRRML